MTFIHLSLQLFFASQIFSKEFFQLDDDTNDWSQEEMSLCSEASVLSCNKVTKVKLLLRQFYQIGIGNKLMKLRFLYMNSLIDDLYEDCLRMTQLNHQRKPSKNIEKYVPTMRDFLTADNGEKLTITSAPT